MPWDPEPPKSRVWSFWCGQTPTLNKLFCRATGSLPEAEGRGQACPWARPTPLLLSAAWGFIQGIPLTCTPRALHLRARVSAPGSWGEARSDTHAGVQLGGHGLLAAQTA